MNEVVKTILKEKPLIVPKVLLQNYKSLNLTEQEVMILICLLNEGDKIPYNPLILTEIIELDKYTIMQILNDLTEKNLIEIKLENNQSGKKEEYIYLDPLYNNLLSIIQDKKISLDQTDIFTTFETELGRTISPMEIEIIKEWLHDGTTEELIKEALKEAIINNVRNLKYVDRIIFNWKRKGLKTKEDILKEKKQYRAPKKITEPIYDYNWLEDE